MSKGKKNPLRDHEGLENCPECGREVGQARFDENCTLCGSRTTLAEFTTINGKTRKITNRRTARQALQSRGLDVVTGSARKDPRSAQTRAQSAEYGLFDGDWLVAYAALTEHGLEVMGKLPPRATRKAPKPRTEADPARAARISAQNSANAKGHGRPKKSEGDKQKQRAIYVRDRDWPLVRLYAENLRTRARTDEPITVKVTLAPAQVPLLQGLLDALKAPKGEGAWTK